MINISQDVTYIINSYNRPIGLENAIRSVINQNYLNMKIIIVDDCSTFDFSLKLNDLIRNNCILIKNKKNLGLAKSRAIGLESADTEYVCFLDDDDELIDAEKTRKQAQALSNNLNAALICTNVIEVTPTGEKYQKKIDWPDSQKKLKSHFFKRNGIIYPSTTMVRKSKFLEVGGFDVNFSRGIDSDVYRRLLIAGHEILFSDFKSINYLVESNDKITDDKNIIGIKKNINSQVMTLKKYWYHYIVHPGSLFFRLVSILKGSIKLANHIFNPSKKT